MFTIFNERSRSISGEHQDVYAKIDVQMRKYINLFRQNKDLNAWGVFTVIALHSNGSGWSWPSTPTIEKETGLISEEAISRAIKHLRTICIDGHVLMHHYRQRMSNGQWGRSYYHVFPEAGGIEDMPVANLVLWQPPPPQQGVAEPVLVQGGDSLSRTILEPEPESKTLPNGNGRKPDSLKRYDERLEAGKLSKTDSILKALAIELFKVKNDPLAIASVEGRLKPILFGQKNGKVIVGLVEWEVKQNGGVPDYEAITNAVQGYSDFCINHANSGGKIVTSEDKFITYWMEYRNQHNSYASEESEMVDDPERPGIRISRKQLQQREEQRRSYEQSQR